MARLPSGDWLIQQSGGWVVLFQDITECEIVAIPVLDENGEPNMDAFARAQKVIHDSPELGEEDRCFAHFWCGYFWAHAASLK